MNRKMETAAKSLKELDAALNKRGINLKNEIKAKNVSAKTIDFEFPQEIFDKYTKKASDKRAVGRLEKYQQEINAELEKFESQFREKINIQQYALDYLNMRRQSEKKAGKLEEIYANYLKEEKLSEKKMTESEKKAKSEYNLKSYDEFKKEIKDKNTRQELLNYLNSFEKTKIISENGTHYYFPVPEYTKEIEKVFKGKEKINNINFLVIREKVREIIMKENERRAKNREMNLEQVLKYVDYYKERMLKKVEEEEIDNFKKIRITPENLDIFKVLSKDQKQAVLEKAQKANAEIEKKWEERKKEKIEKKQEIIEVKSEKKEEIEKIEQEGKDFQKDKEEKKDNQIIEKKNEILPKKSEEIEYILNYIDYCQEEILEKIEEGKIDDLKKIQITLENLDMFEKLSKDQKQAVLEKAQKANAEIEKKWEERKKEKIEKKQEIIEIVDEKGEKIESRKELFKEQSEMQDEEKNQENLIKLKKELDQARKEYLEMDYKKKKLWKRVSDYFRKEFKKETRENDEEVAYFRAIYDNKLFEYKQAILENARKNGVSNEKLGEILKIFELEANINLADSHDQVKLENHEGKFSGFIKKHSAEIIKKYRELPLKWKIGIGATLGLASVGSVYIGGVAISAIMARRFFMGAVAGTSAALIMENKTIRKREENIEKNTNVFLKELENLESPEEKIKLLSEKIEKIIYDENQKINKIKNENLRNLGIGITTGVFAAVVLPKIVNFLGEKNYLSEFIKENPSNIKGIFGLDENDTYEIGKENLNQLNIAKENEKSFSGENLGENATEAEKKDIFSSKETLELATIKKGEGAWHAIYRQLENIMQNNPEEFSRQFNIAEEEFNSPEEAKKILNEKTMNLLIKNEIIDIDNNVELRVLHPGTQVILEGNDIHILDEKGNAEMYEHVFNKNKISDIWNNIKDDDLKNTVRHIRYFLTDGELSVWKDIENKTFDQVKDMSEIPESFLKKIDEFKNSSQEFLGDEVIPGEEEKIKDWTRRIGEVYLENHHG